MSIWTACNWHFWRLNEILCTVHSFITLKKSHILFLIIYVMFFLLLLCIEKIFTLLKIHCLFTGRFLFADPDWSGFDSDFDSSSNGKNSKLKLDIRYRLLDALVWYVYCALKMPLSSYQNEVLMCRCPFKGKSLVALEGEGGFRSGATHFSSKG